MVDSERHGWLSPMVTGWQNPLTMSTHFGDPDEWISQAEAARLRGVSRQAIATLVRRGRLPMLRIAGRTLVRRKDVLTFEPLPAGRPTK